MNVCIRLDNIKLETTMQIINKHFMIYGEGNDVVIIWVKPEEKSVESAPTIFYDAIRLALPHANVWAKEYDLSDDPIFYDLVKGRNTTLLNYYITKDNNFQSNPDEVISLGMKDIERIKEWHDLLIDHNKSQISLRKSSEWKADEWTFALNHYLQACSSKGLEESIINLITGFEALMVTGKEEVSYKVALNASLLISHIPEERERTFKVIKEMYGLRSKVVHGDLPSFVKIMAKPDIYNKYFTLKEILASILINTYEISLKDLHSKLYNAIFECPSILE
jgi:hypothetical protein